MPEHPLVFMDGDVEYMKLCVDIAIYWKGSVFDHRDGVERFYREALRVLWGRIRYFATHEMSHALPVDRASLAILPAWLANPDRTQDIFTLNLEGHLQPDMPSDVALDFWASETDGAGMIRIVLPVGFIHEGARRLRDLAEHLVGEMRFHSGNAGYAISWDHKGEYGFPSLRAMNRLGTRFPCIDFPDPNITLMAIPSGMKRINWITFLGHELLQRLQDAPRVLAELGDQGIAIDRLPGGVMIAAGATPVVGDVNRQTDIEAYRTVGRAVAPLRSPDHGAFLVDDDFEIDEARSEEWLAYFDG